MHAFLKTGKLGGPGAGASSGDNKDKKKSTLKPWVEKYRPRNVDEVAYQEEVVAVLKKSLEGNDLPNLLFYGPPGSGKTSTILAISRQLFGDQFRQRVLELNASDERGIQVIREKVKTFAQNTVSSISSNGHPCPPFKIIILDEADSMTRAAQAALRRTMEKQSKTTRFCLICNYISRIIEPLTSRCAKFRFKPLEKSIILKRLTYICDEEKVEYETEALDTLIDTSEGDLRRAITTLQSAARLKAGEKILAQDIFDITGVVPEQILIDLLEVCKTNSYDKLREFVDDIIIEGYSASQLMSQIHDAIVTNERFTDNQLATICEKVAICDHRLLDGGDETLQIMDLCCTILTCSVQS